MHFTKSHFLLALLMLTGSGCGALNIVNPLVDPADAKPLPALHGVYRTNDCPSNMENFVHVGSAGEKFPAGFLRFIMVSQPKDANTELGSSSFVGFVHQVDESHMLHIPIPKTATDEPQSNFWEHEWDPAQVASYWIIRLSLQTDGLTMAALNIDFLSAEIKAKRLTGLVTQEETEQECGLVVQGKLTIDVTADSKELNAFFTQHLDGKLFDKPSRNYRRVK